MPKGDRDILKADLGDRRSYRYEKWKGAVTSSNPYRCALCGRGSLFEDGPKLVVHHIKSFAQYPELKYEPSNGMVLCVDCHRKVHKGEIQIDG